MDFLGRQISSRSFLGDLTLDTNCPKFQPGFGFLFPLGVGRGRVGGVVKKNSQKQFRGVGGMSPEGQGLACV